MPAIPVITFREALLYWLKLGFTSFGGPAGQIAMMHAELVEKRRWISERRFLHALNYCMVLPGPEATQLAIYIGWLLHRAPGGIVAGALFVLPSLSILIGLSWIYVTFGNLPVVAGLFYGIKPAVVAIVTVAAWRIGNRSIKNAWLAAIAAAAFLAIAVAQAPFPLIVISAAIVGLIGGRIVPAKFEIGGQARDADVARYGAAFIDDDTPPPSHAVFSRGKLIAVSVGGILFGVSSWLLLAAITGSDSPIAKMGLFFSKASLLTFGGAYAVLPYVVQGAVEHYHWLTPEQMMDGLALGETTPGPLIIIVAFVGYLGGWHAAAQTGIAVAGACTAAFFTFLPSFVFVIAGGPLIESTRDNVRLTAPLTAISAAVVGVIGSLGVFFARQVFRLELPWAQWDFAAMVIASVACMAMLRYKVGTIKLIISCAITGLVVSLL